MSETKDDLKRLLILQIQTPDEYRLEKLRDITLEAERYRHNRIRNLVRKYEVWPIYFQNDLVKACKQVSLEDTNLGVYRVDIRRELKRCHQEDRGEINFNHARNDELDEIHPGGWDKFLNVDSLAKELYAKGFILYKADNREHTQFYGNRTYYVGLIGQVPSSKDITQEEVESSLMVVCQDQEIIGSTLVKFAADVMQRQREYEAQKKENCVVM